MEFELRDLEEGDVVQFPKNSVLRRFGVVTGGFGVSTKARGSKIFGIFGKTPGDAVKRYLNYLEQKKKTREKGKPDFTAPLPEGYGFTRRQRCKVVGHVDPGTGEAKENA